MMETGHMPWLVGVDDWLASYGTTATEKNSIPFQRKKGYGTFLPFRPWLHAK